MYCQNCGEKINNSGNFCPNCGTPIKTVVKPSETLAENSCKSNSKIEMDNGSKNQYRKFNIKYFVRLIFALVVLYGSWTLFVCAENEILYILLAIGLGIGALVDVLVSGLNLFPYMKKIICPYCKKEIEIHADTESCDCPICKETIIFYEGIPSKKEMTYRED
ncbi:MAG: zinc-ribbon domain-containing protein [Acutalibacteraceae bacterium]